MPAFILRFGEIGPTGPYLPSLWISLWGVVPAMAQALGAVFVGLIIDHVGRKWPACGLSAFTFGSTAVLYTCSTRQVYLAGRILNSFAIGGIGTIVGVYISEVRASSSAILPMFCFDEVRC